ncbi:MAG: carbon starvation CstA family protein [FCB group bacterium]|jgi:carbon starvation protein|nr:carbon starvation CstA family protein [FCB group bacterium]
MNVLLMLAIAAAAFLLASRFYGAYLARTLGEDASSKTPAQAMNDGRDYVPTKRYVVFAHHFSAIAGAGPIVGPTVAILYGFLPAWLWVVFGGIFIGAVHDFVALFVSMREGGKSMAEVARKSLGNWGFNLIVLFTLIMLVLINAAFLNMTAQSLTSMWPLEKLGLGAGTHLLQIVEINGVPNGQIGGIASTSVIIITLCAPFLGWLLYRRGIRQLYAYLLATCICVSSILLGIWLPISLDPRLWMVILSIYVLFASGTPVWFILQPRDFINVQILYAGIGLLFLSLVIAGGSGATVAMPTFNLEEGTRELGWIWPMMFITIACGAVSGFHSVVASGTTVKQMSSEGDARKIGFNAMLLESLLAVCVLLAISIGLNYADYKSIVWPAAGSGANANPILAFSLGAGHLFNKTLGIPVELATVFGILMVEGFVITTLDAAVRLNRYLFEELWGILFTNPPALIKSYWFNSGLSVVLMVAFAVTNGFKVLWPIFGAGNQLLAALSLLAVSSWLMVRGRKAWFTLAPAAFMMATTIGSLLILLNTYLRDGKYVLVATAIVLLCLSGGVIALVFAKIVRPALMGRPALGAAPTLESGE